MKKSKMQTWISNNYKKYVFIVFLSGLGLGILQGVLLENLTFKIPLFYSSILLIVESTQGGKDGIYSL
jgi:hypothetical protein